MSMFFLSAILSRLPRLDTAARVVANIEAGSVSVSGTPTVATVQNFGVLSRPADAIPLHMSSMGALHIYNNIQVGP